MLCAVDVAESHAASSADLKMPSFARVNLFGRRHMQTTVASSSLPENAKDRQLWLQICFVRPWHVGTVGWSLVPEPL